MAVQVEALSDPFLRWKAYLLSSWGRQPHFRTHWSHPDNYFILRGY